MGSIFADIMRRTVESVPGAVGGSFSARDGELVDAFEGDRERMRLALLTAHYGVVMAHVQAALNTFHFGSAELVILRHERLDILMQAVADGYFAMLAVEETAQLGTAILALDQATIALRQEMA